MKKIIVMLFTLLMLVGCSSKGYSKISIGDDVIFTGPNTKYTKADLYDSLKVCSADAIETDILNKIAANLGIDKTEIEKEAQDMVDMYLSMGYESYIISYYGSSEAYKQMYISNATLVKLAEIYVNDNFDKLLAEDKPIKLQLAFFDTLEAAQGLIDAVNAGSTFDMAAIDNGYNQDCSEAIYLDSDELPVDVKSYINDTDTVGLSKIITVTNTATDSDGNSSSTETYYVLNIISRDINDYKDLYITTKAELVDVAEVKSYFFSNHEIKFYDQDIYEIMKEKYEVLQ